MFVTSSHLPTVSTHSYLVSLLISARSNEDIQSELVEILGFEGQGLQLVEELLQPGARKAFAEQVGEDATAMSGVKVCPVPNAPGNSC